MVSWCDFHKRPTVGEMLGVSYCDACRDRMDAWAEQQRQIWRDDTSGSWSCAVHGCANLLARYGRSANVRYCGRCERTLSEAAEAARECRRLHREAGKARRRAERIREAARKPCVDCAGRVQRSTPTSVRLRCDACEAVHHKYGSRAKKFGLTVQQLLDVLAPGVCQICGTDSPGSRSGFSVDHCHATGVVRGLLCHACNIGLGFLRDDPTRLTAAIGYLTKDHDSEPWNVEVT